MRYFSHSFERQLGWHLLCLALLPVTLLVSAVVLELLTLSLTMLFALAGIWGFAVVTVAYKLTKNHQRLMLRATKQVEAISSCDYSLRHKSFYSSGQSARLQQALFSLCEQLQQQKEQVDEQSFLLYRLIQHLNTPILIFDHRQQLSHGNPACVELLGQPWQTVRFSSATRLGFEHIHSWQLTDPQKAKRWQIRHSEFFDQGKKHLLLICIDIHTALREREQLAWQQMTRVLNHEIRNSLTPISALAQSLVTHIDNQRQQEALQVIVERSAHLQSFVERFAQLKQTITTSYERVSSQEIYNSLNRLFDNTTIHAEGLALTLYIDPTLLNQILINLIKNAIEAMASEIWLSFKTDAQHLHIYVIDNGQGILNPNNLFVPFYSTKAKGQGIGLVLCQHLVEQMQGDLSLKNQLQQSGACAHITLPLSCVAND
ncbi:sensor histidine kinase [Pseudoalteromonas sp. T1lg65]|uniref:sensor histidine kinase n=1 Tax=Pseudoalteromonas sp. T1lg65 TaxID=2077101 RepID=UPI003F7A40F3